MSGREARQAVADCLSVSLPIRKPTWNVYAGPTDNIRLPAIVVGPRSPYSEPGTFNGQDVHLAVYALIPRSTGDQGMDLLDEVIDQIRGALDASPEPIGYERVSYVGMATHGGTECLIASIDCTAST